MSRLALGAEAIVAALEGIDALTPIPQGETGVTYAEKIDKAEAKNPPQVETGVVTHSRFVPFRRGNAR